MLTGLRLRGLVVDSPRVLVRDKREALHQLEKDHFS
jgi:hypothetical protein